MTGPEALIAAFFAAVFVFAAITALHSWRGIARQSKRDRRELEMTPAEWAEGGSYEQD